MFWQLNRISSVKRMSIENNMVKQLKMQIIRTSLSNLTYLYLFYSMFYSYRHHSQDEMCVVYINIIYPVDSDHRLTFVECSADGATFHLEDFFPLVPGMASSTKGDTDQARYIKKYHWKKSVYHST